ncbi:MAG: DUF4368 domain-containing protein [Clostridia bacterium]|nr:DUF4368 domain-containing protein [Clostridia bacterium]
MLFVFLHKFYGAKAKSFFIPKRFAKLSADYEQEQKQLISATEALENELNQEAEQVDNVEYFLNIVRQYTEIKELSARVVNDLIDKIKVHAVDKSSGERVQEVEVHLKFIGRFEVPSEELVKELTPEEIAALEKERIRKQKARIASKKCYEKKKQRRLEEQRQKELAEQQAKEQKQTDEKSA